MKKILALLLASFISFAAFAAEKTISAVMLQDEGSLFEEKDELMKWSKSLDQGTDIKILTIADENGNIVPEEKTAYRLNEKKEKIKNDYYHVKYDDKSYWVIKNRVTLQEKVGVICNETTLYKSPDISDYKNETLAVGTIVTFNTEFKANGKIPMYKVSYFVADGAWAVKTGYVRKDNVSASKDDIKAVRLIKKLANQKDEEVQAELLKNINKLNISEGIKTLAANTKEANSPKDLTAEGYTSVNTNGLIAYEDTAINVRDVPGSKGNVIGSFTQETYVFVIERTNVTEKIGSEENYWYHVQSDDGSITGWVFGPYVQIFDRG